jgi:GMP synthase (glutamine-hydrolysing)
MGKPFVLLQTRPEDAAADNEYEAFMKFSGLTTDQLLRYRIHEGVMPQLKLSDYSGIFIGGGPYCASDPPQKKSHAQKACESVLNKLLDDVVKDDFPLLAACYIGVIIEHEGGLVSRLHPEVIGGYEMSLSTEGQRDRLLAGLPSKFIAFSGHKESCEVAPKDSIILASSTSCPVQLLRIKDNIYVCQFHPELDNSGLALRVQIYKNHGYFPPEAADELVKEAAAHDVSEPVKILSNFVKAYQT